MPLSTTSRKPPTYDDLETGTFPGNMPAAIIGMVISAIAGISIGVAWIIRFLKKHQQKRNSHSPNVWMK